MNIAVLGGTFDPVHNGHLIVAEEAMCRLNLARVLFIPAGQPRLKDAAPLASAEDRLNMVRLAIAGNPGYGLSDIELGRPGPSYTVDTIAELKARDYPADELYFIIGWDCLAEFPRWRQPSRLINLCRLAAVPRVGCDPPDLGALEAAIPGIKDRVVMLDEPRVDISASDIRGRVAAGRGIADLVPAAVAEYIRERGLYREKESDKLERRHDGR